MNPATDKDIDNIVDETAARILDALDDLAIMYGTNATRRIAKKVLEGLPNDYPPKCWQCPGVYGNYPLDYRHAPNQCQYACRRDNDYWKNRCMEPADRAFFEKQLATGGNMNSYAPAPNLGRAIHR